MKGRELTTRDLEILRTLARLRYVTTRELGEAFFGAPRNARRRLHILSDLNLVRPHTRGISPRLTYSAWRLTPSGIASVREAFPDEPLPDGLAERLASGNLVNLDHREEVNRVYLRLVGGADEDVDDESDLAAVTARVAWLRARAFQFWWQPDGDVVLRLRTASGEEQLVPDGTIAGRHRSVRVFVELDRSTYSLARIDGKLRRYARYLREPYAQAFPDRREPWLLYVVRSEQRRVSIESLARRALGAQGRFATLELEEARAWLEQLVFDPAELPAAPSRRLAEEVGAAAPAARLAGDEDGASGAPPASAFVATARELYTWACDYQAELQAEGKDLPEQGRALLRRLYSHLVASEEVRRAG